jgi:hypothetical protein
MYGISFELRDQFSSVAYQDFHKNMEFYASSVAYIGFIRTEEQCTECEKVRKFASHKGKDQNVKEFSTIA